MPKHAFGTGLSWNGATVAQLRNINGIEISAETVDVTTHQSADNYKEFIAGLLEAGDVAIEGLFDETDTAGQYAMLTDMNAGTTRTTVVTFPNSIATWTFTGLITKLKFGDSPIDGAIPFTATIKPSGKPVFAIATSTGLTTPFFALSGSAVVSPAAAGTTYEYVAAVLNAVESITVTPTATAGTITVNGSTVATGEASSAIALTAGEITDITVIVTETNKAPKTYTIHVVRAAA